MKVRKALWMLAAGCPLLAAGLAMQHCRPAPVSARRDFSDTASLRGLVWKCHTTFAMVPDSAGRRNLLEVATYRDEPGLELPWLAGDWRPYRKFCLEASLSEAGSAAFHLTLWDGKGEYGPENRLRRDFTLDGDGKRRCVDIDGKEPTPSGRGLDLSRIRRVVLFSDDPRRPFRFRLASVEVDP
jgi:hypothetical protein